MHTQCTMVPEYNDVQYTLLLTAAKYRISGNVRDYKYLCKIFSCNFFSWGEGTHDLHEKFFTRK